MGDRPGDRPGDHAPHRMVRAFLALLLPGSILSATEEVQDELRARFAPGSVRWVAPENFHLTVRFFGDLDPTSVDRAAAVVGSFEGGFRGVEGSVTCVSAFPSVARPQTLWVGIGDEDGRLYALAAQIDQRLRVAGFGPPDKPWKSHLTVGRAVRGRDPRVSRDWPAGLTWPAGKSRITTVALMRSELRPQGPLYTPLRIATAAP